jgi:dihydrofolate reductase
MRKLIAWDMITVDGYFEGPEKGELDWFRFDDELEKYILETQESAETLLFGRITYEMMAAYWPSAEGRIADFMNSVEKYVFSRTLEKVDWNKTTLVKDNAAQEVEKLKQQPGGDIFIFGSADFTTTLTKNRLIDEYRIGLNPLVLGRGIPLFQEGEEKLDLKLVESMPLRSGLVILHYQQA